MVASSKEPGTALWVFDSEFFSWVEDEDSLESVEEDESDAFSKSPESNKSASKACF